MDTKDLQLELDIKKWIESEVAGKDMCGAYAFCEYCDKDLKDPCAEAYALYEENKEDDEEAPVEVTEVQEDGTVVVKKVYRVLSFAEKLEKAKDETKEKYAAVVALCEAAGCKVLMLRRFVIVRYNGKVAGKITLVRSSLRLHLPLNPASYSKQTHEDYGHFKCYASTPFTLKFKTQKSLKDAEILLPKVTKKLSK